MGAIEMTALAVETAAISVKQESWTPTTYAVTAVGGLMVPFLVALLRFWPTMRKLKDTADQSLRADLLQQVKDARTELKDALSELTRARKDFDRGMRAERIACDRRLAGMQGKMDAMTRQFVTFQLVVVRYLPTDAAASAATAAADRMLEIINTDVSVFEPLLSPEEDPEGLSG